MKRFCWNLWLETPADNTFLQRLADRLSPKFHLLHSCKGYLPPYRAVQSQLFPGHSDPRPLFSHSSHSVWKVPSGLTKRGTGDPDWESVGGRQEGGISCVSCLQPPSLQHNNEELLCVNSTTSRSSIHPSISTAYLRSGHGPAAEAGQLGLPSLQTLRPAPPGGSRGIPRPFERYSLSNVCWVFLETYQSEVSGRHPDQMPKPPHLAPLIVEEQLLFSEFLPDDSASHLLPKGEPSHPTEKTRFGRLYPQSCPCHYPKLMTIVEGRNVNRPVN
ncbi:uncharacterized protein LOC129192723 [Dunckerocampus dactyliophorus]|uniref:uncharacterized protein LOC129192723 n=1 Tax=Dunckerocampus dactyliophorus TaxID=161453 RepID=UPI002404CEFA|nr:uncharacterized protein LOC129192723 [Dunckerocampus dactyliophorus]